MRFTEFFERIYVINLEDRPDRRRQVSAELQRVGLAGERVEVFSARRPDDAGSFPSTGARGCYESHLAVLRQARDRGLRNVLVLEDDVVFSPQLPAAEEELLGQLSSMGWDLVHFAYGPEQSTDGTASTRFALFPFFREIIWTTCYGVNGRSLGLLVTYLETLMRRRPGHYQGGPMPIDGAFNVFRWQYPQIVRLIAIPTIAHQRPSRSDVYPDLAWYDRFPVARSLAGMARGLGFASLIRRLRGSGR